MHPAGCPISSVNFVTDAAASTLSVTDWTVLDFGDNLNLAYSKTYGTGGPIARTYTGYAPCLDPSLDLQGPVKARYPLERYPDDVCNIVIGDLPNADPRYQELALFKSNEFDVQTASGVLATIG